MAVLDQVTSGQSLPIDAARALFSAAIWNWFRANRDKVFYSHKFFAWLSIDVTVERARPLIEMIAGPETPVA